MTNEHLMKLMQQVDPLTVRIPPGLRAIAGAIEAEERERCATLHAEIEQRCAKHGGPLAQWVIDTLALYGRGK